MTAYGRSCCLLLLAACCPAAATTPPPTRGGGSVVEEVEVLDEAVLERIAGVLIGRHGEGQAERVRRGLRQVAERWLPADGDAAELAAFAEEHFLVDEAALADTARHLEYALEMLDGHAHEANREIARFQDLDEGPLRPVDALLAAYDPGSHLSDDLFRSRAAFAALLNFPATTLEQRLAEGMEWSRERWALARLTDRFDHRVPAEVLQTIARVSADAGRYIDGYNIRMDRLVREGAPAGFSEGKKLISHWGLRDEIRAQYGAEGGIERQRLIARVMERIVLQEIPAEVIDADEVQWDPEANRVREVGGTEWREAAREADVRYATLFSVYRANRGADPYFPDRPTHIARSFERFREMPEARVREMLEAVLSSELAGRVGALIAARLGRPLEPFDLWYTGFRPSAGIDEEELSATTRPRWPDAAAFQAEIPQILARLGFAEETARFLGERIVVESSRGPGEAVGAMRREDAAHLRTRIGPEGMDYKGFNIAIHELGHTVEQVFSMTRIDHTLLQGVPNTGFTEAFAFLFQARDLELLGRETPAGVEAEALHAIDRYWDVFEIAGVAILDIDIWHWMYEHPEATAAEVREATVDLARKVWNRWYAPVFGVRDVVLPAIYSHVIAYGLYTPDYPLGMMITSQVEEHVRERDLAAEMERMCTLGRLAPDVWMRQAVGAEVSPEPLLDAARRALGTLGEAPPG